MYGSEGSKCGKTDHNINIQMTREEGGGLGKDGWRRPGVSAEFWGQAGCSPKRRCAAHHAANTSNVAHWHSQPHIQTAYWYPQPHIPIPPTQGITYDQECQRNNGRVAFRLPWIIDLCAAPQLNSMSARHQLLLQCLVSPTLCACN